MRRIIIFLLGMSVPGKTVDFTSSDEQKISLDKKETSPPLPKRIVILPPSAIDLNDDADLDRREGIKKGMKAYREKDYEKAFEWFELAAYHKGGSALGMYYLGSMYFLGEGTTRNIIYAVKYLKVAAEAGLASANFDLGLRYFLGNIVSQDFKKAYKYFSALPLTNPKYKYHLGLILYHYKFDYMEERIRGLEVMISSAEDGYHKAQEIIKRHKLESDLDWFNGEHALALLKKYSSVDAMRGIRLLSKGLGANKCQLMKELVLKNPPIDP